MLSCAISYFILRPFYTVSGKKIFIKYRHIMTLAEGNCTNFVKIYLFCLNANRNLLFQ